MTETRQERPLPRAQGVGGEVPAWPEWGPETRTAEVAAGCPEAQPVVDGGAEAIGGAVAAWQSVMVTAGGIDGTAPGFAAVQAAGPVAGDSPAWGAADAAAGVAGGVAALYWPAQRLWRLDGFAPRFEPATAWLSAVDSGAPQFGAALAVQSVTVDAFLGPVDLWADGPLGQLRRAAVAAHANGDRVRYELLWVEYWGRLEDAQARRKVFEAREGANPRRGRGRQP